VNKFQETSGEYPTQLKPRKIKKEYYQGKYLPTQHIFQIKGGARFWGFSRRLARKIGVIKQTWISEKGLNEGKVFGVPN